MKKILVVLLILSVAGGVFAQNGSWSVSTNAEIGARVYLDPIPGEKVDGEVATVQAIAYHEWDQPRGQLSLTYSTTGGLSTGFNWNSRFSESDAFATYNGDNYRFQTSVAVAGVAGLLGQNDYSEQGEVQDKETRPIYPIKRLWGEYQLLNNIVSLEVALNSRDNGDGDWTSDKAGIFKDIPSQFYQESGLFGDSDSWAKYDHPNLLKAKVNLDVINFGVQVRNLFNWVGGNGGGRYASYSGNGPTDGIAFIDDVIKKSILGFKVDISPLEFAAQFKLEQYGVYFGGRFYAGPVTLGLSFQGLLDDKEDANGDKIVNTGRLKFGGNIDYSAGSFGGGVKAYYDRTGFAGVAGKYDSLIGVQPNFFVNAIPSHLRFQVDTAFYFFSSYDAANDANEKDVIWALQPQLFWNFRGSGAGGYPWGGTAFIARYRLVSDNANFLDLIFKWGM